MLKSFLFFSVSLFTFSTWATPATEMQCVVEYGNPGTKISGEVAELKVPVERLDPNSLGTAKIEANPIGNRYALKDTELKDLKLTVVGNNPGNNSTSPSSIDMTFSVDGIETGSKNISEAGTHEIWIQKGNLKVNAYCDFL